MRGKSKLDMLLSESDRRMSVLRFERTPFFDKREYWKPTRAPEREQRSTRVWGKSLKVRWSNSRAAERPLVKF